MTLALPDRARARLPNFAIETWPSLQAVVATTPGRLLLIAACALMMRPMIPLWPAMAVAAAAMSFLERRYAGYVTAAATVAVFLLSPSWYQHDQLAASAAESGVFDDGRWLIAWGAPALVVAAALGFLAAVRSGRPRWIAAYPQLALILGFLVLLSITASGIASAAAQRWLWSLTSAFSGYMWIVALVAVEQRNRGAQVPFVEVVGAMHPFWTLPATPYTVGPMKLRRLAARDDSALAVSQIKAFKLIVWAYVLLTAGGALDAVAHKTLHIPTFREALQAFDAGGLSWSMRWLSLFVDFFDLIWHLAVVGHLVIACARLAGYNLPRNTYKPLSARTVAEFWGRYYYYFKELMLNLFYFPTFMTCFRDRPQLRAAFATFMAAGVGNLLFHAIREYASFAEVGAWRSIVGLQTYAFYCVALSAGIAYSQWRNAGRPKRSDRLFDRVVSFTVVMLFFCLLHIFDDTRRTLTLAAHLDFLVSLVEPWR